MNKFSKIESLLKCLKCNHDLHYEFERFTCKNCAAEFPIIDNIPRFVPENFWNLDQGSATIQEKTKNYFGFQWDYFKDWGFIKDKDVPENEIDLYRGGRISDRKSAFETKCRLSNSELGKNNVILDAGCGNGRYTYEAATRGTGLVIGIDVGYGSVTSAYHNTKELNNVIIMQCDLFNLPFKDNVFTGCFSNGVLMHTGNASKAFDEISRTIKPEGVFVAHLYNRLNPIWEFNDHIIRFVTTRLSISVNLKFAKFMSALSKKINMLPKGFERINYFFRLQPSIIHMHDWYSAPIATHHTYKELAGWFKKNNFRILDEIPERGLWKQPWAINLKGVKQK
ncbi:MAG TPA: methyltransferase domain-containing protein [Spirochaetota bacterium]|nr:methyltransferase domain-containing protein [Spirochaetota bacterium]HQJ73169.1 methyltransferase domain-containing protein [Spirochaetota bacterium]